jgi:hypothetical protein
MTAIQGSNCAPTGASNPAVATQSQSAGGWYNPFPNPYAYGLPSNGGIVGGFGMNGMGMNGMGMYGGGFGGGFGGQYGPGLINPAVAAYGGGFNTNMYGSYNYQNDNPNSALPSYGYDTAVAPTTFTAPLSGNGTDPNSSGNRVFQEQFVDKNEPFMNLFGALGGAGVGLGIWGLSLGQVVKRGRGGNVGALVFTGLGALAGGLGLNVLFNKFGKPIYTGLDYADNGHIDGSYTTQRGYDVAITKI